MTRPLRVAVFNDSPTMRAAIRAALARAPDIQVVAERDSGEHAASVVTQSHADAAIMDVVMPGVDGYQATRDIMRHHPVPIVMVSSVVDASDAQVVFAALEAGALHIAEPPPSPGAADYVMRCAAFAELLRVVAGARPPDLDRGRDDARTPAPAPAPQRMIDVIGIAASAGGPQALAALLRALPPGVMPPILLVQHLAPGFTRSFAHWLGDTSGHLVLIAAHCQPAAPGAIYMPPEDRHIGLGLHLQIEVSDAPPIERFRPSGNYLFSSLSKHGRHALGVVLSGMGRDGAEGALALRRSGGRVVAQAISSAAVSGMPSAAQQIGAVEAMLPLPEIAGWLARRSGVS